MTQGTTTPEGGRSPTSRPIVLVCLVFGLACLVGGLVGVAIGRFLQGDAPAQPLVETSAYTAEIYSYSIGELSPLGGYLSDLDEGRLRVAPPFGWSLAPRDRDYVARFVFDPLGQSPLPRITIEARDADFQQLRDVSRANLREFHKRFADSLGEDTRQAIGGSLLMLVLGDVPCVSYKLNRQFRGAKRVFAGEREVLVTLHDGRLYTVTLDVYAGKLEHYNADAFAVVAGLRFLQPASSAEEQPAVNEADKSAEGEKGAAAAGEADSTPGTL